METGWTPVIPDGEAETDKSLKQVNGGQGVESGGLNKNGPQRPRIPQLSFKTLQYHNLPSFLAYSLFYKPPLHTGYPELHAGLEKPHALSYLHVSVFDLGLEHTIMFIYTQTWSHYSQKLPFSALALPVFIWHCV